MKLLKQFDSQHERIWAVAFSPNGQYFATANAEGEIHVYEIVTENIPDAQKSRLEETNLYLRITSSLALKHLSVTKTGLPGGLETLQFSPHAQQLAAVTTQPTSQLIIFNYTVSESGFALKLILKQHAHSSPVFALKFTEYTKMGLLTGGRSHFKQWK